VTAVPETADDCPRCGRPAVILPDYPSRACTACALEQWDVLEGKYRQGGYRGVAAPGKLHVVAGLLPVLLTAPKAVRYLRGEAEVKANRWTGSLAEVLAQVTGFGALTAAGPPRRPHLDVPEPAMTDWLAEHAAAIALIVDITGLRDRNIDVCLGMGPLPSAGTVEIAGRIQRAFAARGLRVGMNDPFAALAPVTITAHAQQQLGLAAIQLGLAAWMRDPVGSPTMAKMSLDVLRDALYPIAQALRATPPQAPRADTGNTTGRLP